jgi:hypothetical protein
MVEGYSHGQAGRALITHQHQHDIRLAGGFILDLPLQHICGHVGDEGGAHVLLRQTHVLVPRLGHVRKRLDSQLFIFCLGEGDALEFLGGQGGVEGHRLLKAVKVAVLLQIILKKPVLAIACFHIVHQPPQVFPEGQVGLHKPFGHRRRGAFLPPISQFGVTLLGVQQGVVLEFGIGTQEAFQLFYGKEPVLHVKGIALAVDGRQGAQQLQPG